MRIASVVVLLGVLSACDSARVKAEKATSEAFFAPVKTTLFVPPPPTETPAGLVTFGAATPIAEASCFATADVADGQLVLVTSDDGAITLVGTTDGVGTRETVVAASGRRVSACALSLDAKGQPEIVVAFSAGGDSETMHLRRDASGWRTTRIAPFAAAQVAFNAKSPRGSEVIAVDAWLTSVHAILVDGAWQTRALPATAFAEPGTLAVAVTVDADGRSHFALGANYYGDRGEQYVYWPGDVRADGGNAAGGLAIVVDPADPAQYPQIIHAEAERAAGGGDLVATNLYRTVVGPDSASTSLWAKATAIIGYTQHFAPNVGQLAARIDADGHLHTLAAVLDERSLGSSWSVDYVHDRDGAPHHTAIRDLRATGAVALAGDDRLVANDHGEVVALTRTSLFPKVEPSPVLAPPSAGSVDTCDAGFTDGIVVLRHMTGLSAVALAASDDDRVHALEWDYDRRHVRQTTGDAVGWDTREVVPWQLDIMSAGRSRAATMAGHDHLVWPEGDGLAHWTNASGRWVESAPSIENVSGTPDLATVQGELWLSAIHTAHGASELVVAHFGAGSWSAPRVVAVEGSPEAQALVAAAATPTLLFAERDDEGARLVLAQAADGWQRRELAFSASRVLAISATSVDGDIVAVVSIEDDDGYATVALRIALDVTELGRWPASEATGSRALAAITTDAGAMLLWDAGNVLEAVNVTGRELERRTLRTPEGAVLWTGSATRQGRLVAVVQQTAQAQSYVDLIGEACAR